MNLLEGRLTPVGIVWNVFSIIHVDYNRVYFFMVTLEYYCRLMRFFDCKDLQKISCRSLQSQPLNQTHKPGFNPKWQLSLTVPRRYFHLAPYCCLKYVFVRLFLSIYIPIHSLSFCHDAVWVAVCFVYDISFLIQTLTLNYKLIMLLLIVKIADLG